MNTYDANTDSINAHDINEDDTNADIIQIHAEESIKEDDNLVGGIKEDIFPFEGRKNDDYFAGIEDCDALVSTIALNENSDEDNIYDDCNHCMHAYEHQVIKTNFCNNVLNANADDVQETTTKDNLSTTPETHPADRHQDTHQADRL